MALVDPRDMLNNFCFHVYAQKSMFMGENGNAFFYLILITTRAPGSQLKNSFDHPNVGDFLQDTWR